jgi:hypothetical protein
VPPAAAGPAAPEDDFEVPAQLAPAEGEAPAGVPADPAAVPPPPAVTPAIDAKILARQERADARIADLEAQIAALSQPKAPPPPPPAAEVATEAIETRPDLEGRLGLPRRQTLLVGGFLQAEYQRSSASQDQVQQGGDLLNEDRFLVRRARLRLDRRWTYGAATVEFDGNTARGVLFGLRRAEASVIWDGPQTGSTEPAFALTLGLLDIPFGFELWNSARNRLFTERSLASSAFFAGQSDLGARLAGGWRFARYALAAFNGEPLSETGGRPFRGDPNRAKDIVGRIGVDAAPTDGFWIAGGVSFLEGRGFHAGQEASKNATVWKDINENSVLDPGEVTPVPGTAAVPSVNFRRWAVGADLRLALRTRLGFSRLYGEVVVASNLDRTLLVADPIVAGLDIRHYGWNVALVQDFGRWAVAGFRADVYEPNADLFESRAGQVLPAKQTVTTLSPVLGLRLGRTLLMLQYDAVRDRLARSAEGVPADLSNNRLTVRLHVEL